MDRGTIELCPNETLYGVNWPASSPGAPISAECPKGFNGQSQRVCEQREFRKTVWLSPTFFDCLADDLADIYNEVIYENLFKIFNLDYEARIFMQKQISFVNYNHFPLSYNFFSVSLYLKLFF